MARTNQAAWLQAIKAPLSVGPFEIAHPGEDEVLVRNRAVAMNPVDWMMQDGDYPSEKCPRILGNDIAGEIVEVGEGVTDFHVGQRVLGHCTLLNTDEDRHGGFQEYTVVPTVGCSGIPDGMGFEEACVLPLALSTAAMGLFLHDHLGLRLPGQGKKEGEEGGSVLVWGGSSSVGTAAIQLAVAAGYRVVTTCSERNFELCKSLGASVVLNHSATGVVGDLVAALKEHKSVGAFDAISTKDTQLAVSEVLTQLGGGKLVLTSPARPDLPATVNASMVIAAFILSYHKTLGKQIYNDFLPGALRDGRIKPAPKADVVGHGVDKIEGAVRKLKAGVSASKIVVTL